MNRIKTDYLLSTAFLLILGTLTSIAQTSNANKELLNTYGVFASLPREVIYLHTNKTDFFIGEQIGFTAYVMDKHSGRPSLTTTNLYVQIADGEDNVLKEQLLQVKKGVAFGTILLDSSFTQKNHIIRAFTNWSQNFEEPNTFEQVIRVVDDTDGSNWITDESSKELKVSFIPEGGHFITNALNSLAVSIKDENGFGVPNLTCKLYNEENEVLKTFVLNEKGLAKMLVTPKPGLKFRLSVSHNGEDHFFNLPAAEESGFSLILTERKKKVLLNLYTNNYSLSNLKKNRYRLAIHNGSELKLVDLQKLNENGIAYNIPKKDLFPGINVLTVLDETNLPISERLYFHQRQTTIANQNIQTTRVKGDSIAISLNYQGLDDLSNLSISILPERTMSSNAHHNITSFYQLRPHLKHSMERAIDYFESGHHTKKDLDLMLLVQGWSTYDWSNIMHFLPKPKFEFEKGIQVTIGNNKKRRQDYVAFPHEGIELKKFKYSEQTKTFATDSLFPQKKEVLRISQIVKNGDFEEPLFNNTVAFSPTAIPNFKSNYAPLGYRPLIKNKKTPMDHNWHLALPVDENNIALDEVVVTENKVQDKRLQQLIAFSHGKVTVFDDKLRKAWRNLENFITPYGYRVRTDSSGSKSILRVSPPGGQPAIYVDDVLWNTTGPLDPLLEMNTLDIAYIEVNKFDIGEGLRGAGGGAIRIFRRYDYSDDYKYPYKYLNYEYPLTFDLPDKYTVPLYSSYLNGSYRKYGVVGWFPDLKLDEDGKIKFTIPNSMQDRITLNIQGFTENGRLISEVKHIDLN